MRHFVSIAKLLLASYIILVGSKEFKAFCLTNNINHFYGVNAMLLCSSERSILDSQEIKKRIESESNQIFEIFDKYKGRGLVKTASSGDEDVSTECENLKCSVGVSEICEEII